MSSLERGCVERVSVECDTRAGEISVEELARSAQAGDAEAFGELAGRLRPRLLVLLSKRLGGNVADAEDVAQEAFAKAWTRIAYYDGSRSFSAWMYTIAFRAATDFARRQRRRAKYTKRVAPVEASSRDAKQALIDRETTDNLWSTAEQELTTPQYVALWLRYAEDLSVSEIAEVTGKTRVATRVLLHRARSKLQSRLAAENQLDET